MPTARVRQPDGSAPDEQALSRIHDVFGRAVADLAPLAFDLVSPRKAGAVLDIDAVKRRVAPQAHYLLRSLLHVMLEEEDVAFDHGHYVFVSAAEPDPASAARDALGRAGDLGSNDPVFPLLASWWDGVGAFLRGDRNGVEVLFPRADLSRWAALHRSSALMRHYAEIGASLASDRMRPGANVLEIGGGTGAALHCLLAREEIDDLAEYCFTDISPAFFQSIPTPAPPSIVCRRFDFNEAPDAQGLEPGRFDVVLGVNALHAATDIGAATRHVARLIRPDGWLVLGEGAPGGDGRMWRPDLLFAMLPGWWNVHLHPVMRPRSGFLTLEEWDRILRPHGLEIDRGAPHTFRPRWFGGGFRARRLGE